MDATITKTYYKKATSNENILGIRKEKPDVDCCACWSLVIAKDKFVSVTHREIVLVLYISIWQALWY